jgi:hypothetical protein
MHIEKKSLVNNKVAAATIIAISTRGVWTSASLLQPAY